MKKLFLWLITVGLLLCCLFSTVGCGDASPSSSDDASSGMVYIDLIPPDSSAGSYQTSDGETLHDVIPYSIEDSFDDGVIVEEGIEIESTWRRAPFEADLILERSEMERMFWPDASSFDDDFFEYYALVRIRMCCAPEDTIQVNFLALSEEGLVVDCTFFEHLVAADAECTKALLLKVEKALIADIPATILTQQHTRKQDAYGRYYWAE